MLVNTRLIVVFAMILLSCGKVPSSSSTSANKIPPEKVERPAYQNPDSLTDILDAPVMEIPEPGVIPNWKKEGRVKNVEFQMPAGLQPNHQTVVAPATIGSVQTTQKGSVFSVGEFRIIFVIWENIAFEDYIKNQYQSGLFQRTIIKVRKIKKPRAGYYFEQNLFGDYVFELVLDGGKDTYDFSVIRPVRGTEKEPSKVNISDEEILKILYSLRLLTQ